MDFALIFGVLWGVSEALALIPWVKSNSIFTLIYNLLKSVAGPKLPPA